MKKVEEMGRGSYIEHQADQTAAANNGGADTLTYFGNRSEVK
jgi:hypothetical protein